ncbi:kinetochore protein Mis12 [Desmophyllum pertusum]|uniref:Protein MIS12 homolog n=1 Tax=Desmophyllum pertusum TaxID=174260 RepID=A0A9X0DC63_9CNID|nr:kinetochore protein Mis12 [Desmophyllum pertusum]
MANNFYKSIDQAFDRFEVYVKNNLFKIPAGVLLPEDKVHHDHPYAVEDEEKLDKECEELEKKIKATKYVNTALKQEVKDLDNAQEQIDNFEKTHKCSREGF